MKIVIATTNEGKKKEMLEFFTGIEDITWLSLADFDPIEDLEETGTTFEENALLKAKYYGDVLQKPVLGEDSGLTLDAFPEKFGIRTRRELDAEDDTDWLGQFLEMLEPVENRRATFYSSLAFYDPTKNEEYVVLGTTNGEIEEFPQTPLEKGIPVSAVFRPDGSDEVFSAMKKNEKNEVSHRGKACRAMQQFLVKQL